MRFVLWESHGILVTLAGYDEKVIICTMGRMGAEERQKRDDAFEALMASVNADWALRREMKAARKRAGLSQEELAKRMGTGQALIGRLEQGTSVPTIKTLRRIAQVTGSKLVVRLEPE